MRVAQRRAIGRAALSQASGCSLPPASGPLASVRQYCRLPESSLAPGAVFEPDPDGLTGAVARAASTMLGELPIPRLEAARVCFTPSDRGDYHRSARPSPQLPPTTAAPPSPALAPGRSPTPSRLTHTPGARPLTGLPSGREAGELQVTSARPSAAARIGELCSAPATPEAACEGGAQSSGGGTNPVRSSTALTAGTTEGAPGTTAHASSLSALTAAVAVATSPLTAAPRTTTYLRTPATTSAAIASPLPTEAGRWAGGSGGDGCVDHADRLPHTATTSRTTWGRLNLKAPSSTQSTPAGGIARLRTHNQGVI